MALAAKRILVTDTGNDEDEAIPAVLSSLRAYTRRTPTLPVAVQSNYFFLFFFLFRFFSPTVRGRHLDEAEEEKEKEIRDTSDHHRQILFPFLLFLYLHPKEIRFALSKFNAVLSRKY